MEGTQERVWKPCYPAHDTLNGRSIGKHFSGRCFDSYANAFSKALATKVAIMGTKMLATGTLSSLQQRYGGAFVIRAVRAPNTDSATVEHEVKKRFEDVVKDYTDSHGQVTFSLPHVKSHLGSIMRTMEELKGEKMAEEVEEESDIGLSGSSRVGGASAVQAKKDTLVYFSDYTINGPTLEEVFMNVARESGIAGEA